MGEYPLSFRVSIDSTTPLTQAITTIPVMADHCTINTNFPVLYRAIFFKLGIFNCRVLLAKKYRNFDLLRFFSVVQLVKVLFLVIHSSPAKYDFQTFG
jgi:hypothetical protein